MNRTVLIAWRSPNIAATRTFTCFTATANWQVQNDDLVDSLDEAIREACWVYEGLVREDLSGRERGEQDDIDLDAATLLELVNRDDHVAAVFDPRPSWARMSEDKAPLYRCEIRVWNGSVERFDENLPLQMNDDEQFAADVAPITWSIEYRGGGRSSWLPIGFAEDGPARLSFGPSGDPTIVVVGDRVSLEVGERVGFVQVQPTP